MTRSDLLERQIVKNRKSKTWCYQSDGSTDSKVEFQKCFRAIKTSKICSSLRIESWQMVSNKEMSILSEGLKRLTWLKSLYLNLDGCWDVTNEGIETLKQGLKKLSSLKSSNIILCQLGNTDESIKCLSRALRSLHSLREVFLNINSSFERSTQSLGMLYLEKSLKRLDSIEKITLNFEYLQNKEILPNLIFGSLKRCLQRFPNLKNLKLVPSGFSEEEDGFKMFTECIKELRLLETLTLSLKANKITDHDLRILGETLKKLENLSEINLNVSEYCLIGKLFT